jgi:hypothetical protein
MSNRATPIACPWRTNLVAVSAADGSVLWDHPHGNFQLIIRDDALYAMGRTDTSKKFDLRTGKILADLDCFPGNCTRATGTADAIFARGHSHAGTLRLSVADDQPHRIPAMRPGCQDGVIAANGQLYWGPWMCDCNHSPVGIISMAPAGEFDFEIRANNDARLRRTISMIPEPRPFNVTANDWPAYRKDNQRAAQTKAKTPVKPRKAWTFQSSTKAAPTAPTTADGLVFLGGDDGVIRALDATTARRRIFRPRLSRFHRLCHSPSSQTCRVVHSPSLAYRDRRHNVDGAARPVFLFAILLLRRSLLEYVRFKSAGRSV